MKPHLPKALLVSVLAACFFTSQAVYALTDWGNANDFDGAAYYIDSKLVGTIDATAETETTIGIFNDTNSDEFEATVNTLKLKDGGTLKLVGNPWHSGRFFTPLTIENLEIAGDGSAKIVNGAGSSLVLKGITGSLAGTSESDPSIENNGRLTLVGNLSGTGTVSVAGSGTFATGGNTIDTNLSIANGATLEFDGTIKMGEGKTLAFETEAAITLGSVSFDNFDHGETTKQNYEGGNADNGIFSTTVTLVSGGTIAGELTLSHKGNTYTINNDNRTLAFSDGFYYLNVGTADLSDINTLAADDRPLSVQMAAGTTLNMDTALADDQSVVVNGNSTITSSTVVLSRQNVTVNNGAVLTLTGTGTYNNGANGTLNSAIALGEGWEGNVIVDSARGVTNFNIDSFAKIKADGTSASTVTLRGVSGYLQEARDNHPITHRANLSLENTPDGAFAALEITNGWSGTNDTDPGDHHIFAGTVSGEGNFIHNKDLGNGEIKNRKTFEFTNDVSGWKGNLENVAGIATFRFTGDAVTINNLHIKNRGNSTEEINNKMDLEFIHDKAATVNSQILKEDTTSQGSRVTVKVANSSEAGTIFTKTVNVSKIDVTNGTKAAFNGTTTTDELTMGAGSTLSGTGTVTATNFNVSGTGTLQADVTATNLSMEAGSTLTVNENSTLTISSGFTLDGNSIEVASGSTLNLTGGTIDIIAVTQDSESTPDKVAGNNGWGTVAHSVNFSDYIQGDGTKNTTGVAWSINGHVATQSGNMLTYTENGDTYYIYNAGAEAAYSGAAHLVVDIDKGNTYNLGIAANTTLESLTITSGMVTTGYVSPNTWSDPNYGDAFMRGDITIESGGELQLAGEGAGANDALGWNEHATKSISLSGGEGEGNEAKLTLAYTETTGSTTLKTDLNLKGNALVSGGEFNSFGGDITATGTNNTFASNLAMREALTVNVTESSDSLLISGNISGYTDASGSDFTGALTKTGAGQLEITGTINGGNRHTINGGNTTTISSTSIQDATIQHAKLASESGQNLSGTMSLTNVTLAGTINITGGTTTYTQGTIKLDGQNAKIIISQGATFSNDGFDYTAYDSSKSASIQGGIGSTSLELYHGNVSISNASMEKKSTDGKHISIALNNVDLTLNSSGGNDNRLFGDKTQSLRNLTVNGGILDVESAATVSGTTKIGTGATVVIMNADADLGSVTGAGTVKSQKEAPENTASEFAVSTAAGFTGTLTATGNTTLTDVGTGSGFNVVATDGDIVLLNRATEVTLQSLVLGSGHSLTIGGSPVQTSAADEPDAALAAGVRVTDTVTLQGGSSVVGGGLNLTSTQTLEINDIGNGTITLGGALILPTGGSITLAGDILDTLAGLAKGDTLNVFSGVTSLTLGDTDYTGVLEAAEATDLTNYFRGLGVGYQLGYTGAANGGVVYIQKNVPEPTTATLGLLALAALAARRRRKD